MAVKVTPARGMNGISTKTFENATGYKTTTTPLGVQLDIYAGQKRIASYGPNYWEIVEIIELLDAPRYGGDAPIVTKSRNGDKIRTSPHRKGGKVAEGKAGK